MIVLNPQISFGYCSKRSNSAATAGGSADRRRPIRPSRRNSSSKCPKAARTGCRTRWHHRAAAHRQMSLQKTMNDILVKSCQFHTPQYHPMSKVGGTLQVNAGGPRGIATLDQVLDVSVSDKPERGINEPINRRTRKPRARKFTHELLPSESLGLQRERAKIIESKSIAACAQGAGN